MPALWLEQTSAEMRLEADWLSPAELTHLANLRIPKRRDEWRLGRWTAKCAVANYLGLSIHPPHLAAIEIRPAKSGAPEVFQKNRPASVSISLSHRAGRAVCAVADAGVVLGCDLEVVEPRCDAFVSDYFLPEEQQFLSGAADTDRFRVLALLWSAKESTLKALRTGLRADTRWVAIHVGEYPGPLECNGTSEAGCGSALRMQTWQPFRSVYLNEQIFEGWWEFGKDLVRTMISVPALPAPLSMNMTIIED